MSISVSSALDCSILGWRCWQLQHYCQIQYFVNNQKIIILDKPVCAKFSENVILETITPLLDGK
jgi:hypothetical protein